MFDSPKPAPPQNYETVEEYLARGGIIQYIPVGVTSETDNLGKHRKEKQNAFNTSDLNA